MWKVRMVMNGWQKRANGTYVYHRKVAGKELTIPAHAAKTWESWGLVPTLKGVQRV